MAMIAQAEGACKRGARAEGYPSLLFSVAGAGAEGGLFIMSGYFPPPYRAAAQETGSKAAAPPPLSVPPPEAAEIRAEGKNTLII